MKFGEERLDRAEGAILAHSLRLGRAVLKKGQRLGPDELALIDRAGLKRVTIARLDGGDISEDEAARRVAAALTGGGVVAEPAATGRVNLHAAQAGLLAFDPAAIDALNAITEDVTLATLPLWTPVESGRMVATIKIIPFAVPDSDLRRCIDAGLAARVSAHPFRPLSAGLIQTRHDGLKPTVMEKTSRVTAERLGRIGSTLSGEWRCAHAVAPLAALLADRVAERPDVLLVIGASAIVDRRDVIPAAIERMGGHIERLGMPVDPGNLILIADIAGVPVLGLPGCARSPARNGLDWILERISAELPVDHALVSRMGVGGLLIGREEEKDYR